MKHIFLKTAAFVLSMVGFVACKGDFLDRPPLDRLTDGTYYNNADELLAGTSPLYNVVWFDYNGKSSFAIGDARGGNMISNSWNQFYQFSASATDPEISTAWTSFYNTIAQSNMVIYNVNNRSKPGVPDNAKRGAIGEARYMRGLAYSHLVMNWGAIPIIDDNIKQMNDTTIARNTVESVWDFIIRDLSYAARNLPDVSPQKGRLNKYAAQGMLARMFLTRAGVRAVGGKRNQSDLDSAKYYAASVIKNGPYKLVDNYADLFLTKNNNNPESMFALQWVYNGNWGTQNTFQAFMAFDGTVTGTWDGWGRAHGASADYLRSLDPADSVRRKASFMLMGDVYPEIRQKDGGLKYTFDDISNVKKYIVGTAADNDGKVDGMRTENNTYMQRLAEVYLIYAEAILGDNTSTSDSEALRYYNAVRNRAKLSSKTSITYDDIAHERRYEFAMEGDYWYQLVRLYYFNPTKAKTIINKQDKGAYRVAIKKGTGTSTSNPRVFEFTFTPTYYAVNDNSFYLPYPEVELAKAPNLRKPPVPFKF